MVLYLYLYKSINTCKYVVTADVLFYQTHSEHSARIVYPTTIIVFPSLIVLYQVAARKWRQPTKWNWNVRDSPSPREMGRARRAKSPINFRISRFNVTERHNIARLSTVVFNHSREQQRTLRPWNASHGRVRSYLSFEKRTRSLSANAPKIANVRPSRIDDRVISRRFKTRSTVH